MPSRKSWFNSLLLAGLLPLQDAYAQQYLLGSSGKTNMMGYADLSQTDTGLHMRQFSRAFIVATPGTNSAKDRILFINSDLQSGDTAIRRGILDQLNQLYPGLVFIRPWNHRPTPNYFFRLYTEANVALVGTHSHAGVGGFLNNLLPTLTSLGFVKQTYDAIVNGTVLAVKRAHESLAPEHSRSAMLLARYQYDQDKELHLLKFTDNSGTARGLLSFFAVHGTSLYQNNTLVSTDNKGMAAYLYEADVQPDAAPGKNTFVAGFVQANVGDTTPNTLGAFCESPGKPWDGQPCEYQKSTCGNVTQGCHGRGPGFQISDFESNRIIGENQYLGAKKLMASNSLTAVKGAVRSLHTYVNMSNYSFPLSNGTTVHTCPPAMGYSFAGGTSDGPGAFDFTQGETADGTQNPFWEIVKGIITAPPSQEQKQCHYPKPILLNTGYTKFPYAWQPDIVDIQMMRVGQFVVLVVPGEFTTMAGVESGNRMAGPANTYSHYVTTREEYGIQRYEGASTIYGPFTLEAYQNLTLDCRAHSGGLGQEAISLQTGVVFDAAPIGKSFGSVLTDNNLRLEGTFLTIDRLTGSTWSTYRTDSHPSTKFRWTRTNTVLGHSTVEVEWIIESNAPAGTYRVTYYGDSNH
ncbi:hypothetical protein RhiXN_07235 [Rhizoctonia solani]|uniref:Neutral ceramidase n=1 Tax=Rhizoctonia solani TaxID=456999 RepID=A0A8H8T0D6_9AGAM|nr:uncharacterized protein RhiXN_07235 [Rhizoctonia solani]QRW25286.1 hypothetical protein RhiXN_07235 [Rhizoctonia solani]